MDKIPNSILTSLKDYYRKIENDKIRVEKMILFGSYVSGKYTDDSDIDVAIISKDFSGIRYYDREKLADATIKSDSRIEPHPISYEDYKNPNPFVEEILKTGIVVYN